MKADIFDHLEEFNPASGKRLNGNIRRGLMTGSHYGNPYVDLIEPHVVANNNYRWTVKKGVNSIKSKSGQFRREKLKTFGEDGLITRLNIALKGETNYPILSAITGVLFGRANPAMGLIFSAASTASAMAKTSNDALARPGDELWKIEEIGKVKERGVYKVIHVYSLFLVDPFRNLSSFRNVGWLIHEDRTYVAID